jgi:polysaccharide export outer membrane protein
MWWLISMVLAADIQPDPNYRLGHGDILSLEVFGEPDMSRQLRVSDDGTISVPFAGAVAVEGLTVDQAQALVTQKLAGSVLVAPQVVLQVEEYGRTVEVYGKVKNVGRYPIIRDGMTVTQLLTEAGGTEEPSAPLAILIRGDQEFPVDLVRINAGDISQDIVVQAGDRIFVPDTGQITVSGCVNDPDLIPYRPGLRFTDAIAAAGGLTQVAKKKGIRLIRDGKTILINYNRVLEQKEENIELKAGDIIEVPESAI